MNHLKLDNLIFVTPVKHNNKENKPVCLAPKKNKNKLKFVTPSKKKFLQEINPLFLSP